MTVFLVRSIQKHLEMKAGATREESGKFFAVSGECNVLFSSHLRRHDHNRT
jgi:hypothetical protein